MPTTQRDQPAPFDQPVSSKTRDWLKGSSPMLKAQLSTAAIIATATRASATLPV